MRYRWVLFWAAFSLPLTVPVARRALAQDTSKLIGEDVHTPQLLPRDAILIREFYRLAPQIADDVWPDWSRTLAPLLLVTNEGEFLTHHPDPPADFERIGDNLYARQRHFSVNLLATFPAFGPRPVIVIGEPENTEAKTCTPWLITLMHEHFHQLQDTQPGMMAATNELNLAHGDQTGMWMLNYPFPYDKPEIARSFSDLRNLLLAALNEKKETKFRALAQQYGAERRKFFAQLAPEDRKYLSFQLWKEGIARYVQVKSAEAAAHYEATAEFAALSGYESFSAYAGRFRGDTMRELSQADLAKWKRTVVYSFGACEGFLLDRVNPKWTEGYFKDLFTLDPYFAN
ncbi:MAG TPA: hypothetical protein VMI10_07815 [Terriglobales bacterium]|nr:hypothetical protein [Terriglobales bacterium]